MGTAVNQIATITDCQALDSTSFTTSTTLEQKSKCPTRSEITSYFYYKNSYSTTQLVKYEDIIKKIQSSAINIIGWGNNGLSSVNTSANGYPLYAIYGSTGYTNKYFTINPTLKRTSNSSILATNTASLYYNTIAQTHTGAAGSSLDIGANTISLELKFSFSASTVAITAIGKQASSFNNLYLQKTITIPVSIYNGATTYTQDCVITYTSSNKLTSSTSTYNFSSYIATINIDIPAPQGPSPIYVITIGTPTCVWTGTTDSGTGTTPGGGTGGSGSYAGTAAIWEDLEGE